MSADIHPPMTAERLFAELRNGGIIKVRPIYSAGKIKRKEACLLKPDMTSETFQYSALQSLIWQGKVVCVEIWSGNKYTWALSPKWKD